MTRPFTFQFVLGALPVVLLAPTARAEPCPDPQCGYDECRAGAVPVPPVDGDVFAAVDGAPLPASRDISPWKQNMSFHDGLHPFFTDLDIEGNDIFTANSTGMQIWEHTGTAAFPQRSKVYLGASGGTGARWCATPELKHPIQWIDVLDGDGDVAAIGSGHCELGVLVFDTTNKASPQLKYQADNYDTAGVWTTKIGDAQYLVAGGRSVGAHVYDLAAARALDALCRDELIGDASCGVYQRKLGAMNAITGVHGTGRHVALSGPQIEIHDLGGASEAPLLAFDPGLGGFNFGVSLVAFAGSTYLTAAYYPSEGSDVELGLWDVGACLEGPCDGPGAPLTVATIPGINLPRYLATSFRAGRPFIYVGTEFTCTRDEADWLFELTKTGRSASLTRIETRPDYWEWYYGASNVNGTFDARPRRAKFLGDHLYRAMWTFFDVHEYRGEDTPICGDGVCAPGLEDRSGCPADCTDDTDTDTSTGDPPGGTTDTSSSTDTSTPTGTSDPNVTSDPTVTSSPTTEAPPGDEGGATGATDTAGSSSEQGCGCTSQAATDPRLIGLVALLSLPWLRRRASRANRRDLGGR